MPRQKSPYRGMTVRMDPAVVDHLDSIASFVHWDRSILVRMAIEDFVDQVNSQRPQNYLMVKRVVRKNKTKAGEA